MEQQAAKAPGLYENLPWGHGWELCLRCRGSIGTRVRVERKRKLLFFLLQVLFGNLVTCPY